MTVYVDNMRARVPVVGTLRNCRWSHLIADTEEELHAFAARLGLQRRWFQDPRDKHPEWPLDSCAANTWHYDVVDAKRRQAIAMGAVEIELRELPDLIHSRMTTGRCRPEPGVAR
jgi:hypothetical protein